MAVISLSAFRSACTVSAFVFAAVGAHAEDRFAVSADGQQVTDAKSGLVWRRCAEGMTWSGSACTGKPARFTYAAAKSAAVQGWRVPTRDELRSLVDMAAKKKPKIDATAFPNTPAMSFWASRPGADDNLNAWLINFANGKLYGNVGQAKFPLRLVRASAT